MRLSKYASILLAFTALLLLLPAIYDFLLRPVYAPVQLNYSYIQQSFFRQTRVDNTNRFYDESGQQVDALTYYKALPELFYKRLIHEGVSIDSIVGEHVNVANWGAHTAFFKVAKQKNNDIPLRYSTFFEPLGEDGKFILTDRFYYLQKGLTFFDPIGRDVDESLSSKVNEELKKQGFRYPVQWVFVNEALQKRYDTGNYLVDAVGKLFAVQLSENTIKLLPLSLPTVSPVVHIECTDPADHEYHALVFTADQKIHLLLGNTNVIVTLPIDDFDVEEDEILLFSNVNFKQFSLDNGETKRVYAIDNNYELIDSCSFRYAPYSSSVYSVIKSLLFPVHFTLNIGNGQALSPQLKYSFTVWIVLFNLMLAMLFRVFSKAGQKNPTICFATVLLTGVYGLLVVWMFSSARSGS
jgi:hypothetical protein